MHLYELKDAKGRMTMELGFFDREDKAKNAVGKIIAPSNSVFLAKITGSGYVKIADIKGAK